MTGPADGDGSPAGPHPSRRLLERVAFEPDDAAMTGATPPAPAAAANDEAGVRAHVGACAACAEEIAAMRAAAARFVAARPAAAFARAVEHRAKAAGRRRAVGGGVALLGAAAAALLIAGPRLRPTDPGGSQIGVSGGGGPIRSKGGGPVDLRLYVSRHGEDAQPLDPAAPLHAGEVLRFAATIPADGYVLVLDLDGAGRISRYHPTAEPGSNTGAPIQRGQSFLPESIHLDDFVGDELIALVFSTEALDVGAATRALQDAFRAAGGALDRITGWNLPGAQVALVRVRKERR